MDFHDFLEFFSIETSEVKATGKKWFLDFLKNMMYKNWDSVLLTSEKKMTKSCQNTKKIVILLAVVAPKKKN